uniref:Sema domain-containing protein n=1 Tax=Macrostomum lignano TaxID=282301 RepID=A0A1I8J791_9PLAT
MPNALNIPELFTLLWLLAHACLAVELSTEKTSYTGRNFTHIELYTDRNGVEYIVLAQPDQLINIRADFQHAYVTAIGPKNDSAKCLPHQVRQGLAKCNIQPMANHVKAMTVKSGYLYFCMTYLCGSCDRTPLTPDQQLVVNFTAIDEKLKSATRAVLCRDPAAKTTLTVAPKYYSLEASPEPGLYLAMPFCIANNLNLESSVESVMSIVSLSTMQPFKIGDFSPFWSEVIPSSNKRKQDVLSYHYSFSYNSGSYSYVYYLLTAKSVRNSEFSEMRIGRFCSMDLYLSGYVEMFITCNVPDADQQLRFGYFGEAATFVLPGRQLARSLNASPDEPMLFYTARVLDQELNKRQGVCAVPIAELNRRLDAIISDCGRGFGYRGPSYIRQHFPCSNRGGWESADGPPFCAGSSGLQTEWTGTVDRMGSQHSYYGRFLALVDPATELLTSLAARPVYNGRTALFVGTSVGGLIRYSVGQVDYGSSTMYDRADVADGRAEAVTELRAGASRLFALTASKVSSHPYADCETRYKTCQSCLESRDPHCVWSNRDTVGCLTWLKPEQPDRDIITSAAECLQVSSVINSSINVNASIMDTLVTLVVTKEPNVGIYCYYMNSDNDGTVFETRPSELQLYRAGVGVSCRLSVPDLRQYLGEMVSRNLTVRLSSAPSDATHYLVSVAVQIYNCRRHPNCTRCVGSSAPCRWMPLKSNCVAASDVASASSSAADVVVSGVAECPAVWPLRRLVLPSGHSEDLDFSLSGFYPAFMRSFICELNCSQQPSGPLRLPATILSYSNSSSSAAHPVLRCSVFELSYAEHEPVRVCRLNIVWHDGLGSSGDLDSPVAADGGEDGGSLRLYKCHRMAEQCDDCTLYTEELYRCVWCVASRRCSPTCPTSSAALPAAAASASVPRRGLCPAPRIDRIEPARLAEFVSGLELAVSGANLGNSADGVDAYLMLHHPSPAPPLACSLVPGSYRPGKAFRCRLLAGPADGSTLQLGSEYRLRVRLTGTGAQAGSAETTYSEPLMVGRPAVTAVSADRVQQSGRPLVTLFGSQLDSGSSLQVTMLSDKYMFVSSEVLTRTADNVTVRLGNFHHTGIYFVSTTVQNCSESKRYYRNILLQVLPDAQPKILRGSLRRGLIPSGGLPFDIDDGVGLEAVVNAEMIFFDVAANKNYSSSCARRNRTLTSLANGDGAVVWSCPSPAVPAPPPAEASQSTASRDGTTAQELRVKRSAAASSQQYGNNFTIKYRLDSLWFDYPISVSLVPDPELLEVPSIVSVALDTDSRQQLGSREFKIRGRNLIPTLLVSDVTVMLGDWHCPAQDILKETQLQAITCRTPEDPLFFNEPHPVTVRIGYRTYQLGTVTFSLPNSSLAYILGGAALFFLVCVVIGIVCCVRCYVRSKDQDKSKNLEHRMNLLEAKMSQTCRDAFAELQLNSDGTDGAACGDPDGGGMPAPCRSFEEFACYTCFPERYETRFAKGDEIFADVVRSRNSAEDSTESQGLEELDRLLHNRLFLLTMIDALEFNVEKFRHHERSQFGSLLSALLLEDMECFTDLLTRLIVQLIKRKQEKQDNYKVVFRRCDSVAERLLPNWLAFLMYEQLSDKVVEPFYRLYLRIKREVYKGPVDQCTEDSKYTINEQRLLRKDITFHPVKLTFRDRLEVLQPLGSDGEPWTCRVDVLDCDSIYQAKLKLLDVAYTRLQVRFSRREPPEIFELVGADADAHDLPLHEEQVTGTDVRHKCLSDYSIAGDSAVVYLRRRPATAESNGTMYRSLASRLASNSETPTLMQKSHSSKSLIDNGLTPKSPALTPGGGAYATVQNQPGGGGGTGGKSKGIPPRHYHLAQPYNGSLTLERSSRKKSKQADRSQNGQQTVPEAYLPILLSTKKNLTDNITDLFGALFPAHEPVPLCIKYLFDQLDDIARDTEFTRDAAHIWKSNALTLRFYMQLLMNAQHLLDVEIQGPPDRSAPSQRLLFVKEIADFHPKVEAYYAAVRSGIREPKNEMLTKFKKQVTSRSCSPFCRTALLRELYSEFVYKFQNERRIQHHMMQQQQQQPFQPHTPLTYQQMQLGPSHHTMGPSSPHNSSYVYPTMSSVNSSNRSILHTFGQHDPYA